MKLLQKEFFDSYVDFPISYSGQVFIGFIHDLIDFSLVHLDFFVPTLPNRNSPNPWNE